MTIELSQEDIFVKSLTKLIEIYDLEMIEAREGEWQKLLYRQGLAIRGLRLVRPVSYLPIYQTVEEKRGNRW